MSIVKSIKRIVHGVLSELRPVKMIDVHISYLKPNERLNGKNILITGGNKGIGLALAKKFIEEGANVLIAGRNEELLKKSSIDIGCRYMILDVSDDQQIEKAIDNAVKLLGRIDVLVNNAGISLHEGSIKNVSFSQFDSQFDVNLRGGYFLSKNFIRYCNQTGQVNSSILFVSSECGQWVSDIPYGLTKVAINSLTQGLSRLVLREGIRVNAIAPGVTATSLVGMSGDSNLFADWQANNRIYLPEEVAEVACFLISDVSKCISGQIIYCNEGKSINSFRKV